MGETDVSRITMNNALTSIYRAMIFRGLITNTSKENWYSEKYLININNINAMSYYFSKLPATE